MVMSNTNTLTKPKVESPADVEVSKKEDTQPAKGNRYEVKSVKADKKSITLEFGDGQKRLINLTSTEVVADVRDYFQIVE